MSREIFQKYGFIVALVIAGITLPTSIISFMREPTTTNNYYEENYYYENNETNTEPVYTKPLETVEYYNFDRYDCVVRNFTLSSSYAYWYYWNASAVIRLLLWVTRGIFYDKIVELNGTVECYQFLDSVDVHEKGETKDDFSSFFIPPYLSEWLFVFIRDEVITVNITITDEILKI